MWSKIKQVLRSRAPRSEEELLQAALIAFNAISTADCKGSFYRPIRYIINGYALTDLNMPPG